MHLGLSLQTSQKLEIRASMEARLELAMRIEQKLVIELRLYLQREDEFKKLYAAALKRGDVRWYEKHGLRFEYARIRRKELPAMLANERSCGFAHCLYEAWDALLFGQTIALARGSWLLFVCPDFFAPLTFPETYVEYVAVHEHGEEVTLGHHDLASKLEFATALKEQTLTRYIRWLEDHYPEKFADVFSNQTRIVLPDSDEFQQMLELKSQADYAGHVRKMIEGFKWPFRVLQKLSLYEHKSREVEEELQRGCVVASGIAHDLSASTTIADAIAILDNALVRYLRKVLLQRRFVCWPRAKAAYRNHRSLVAAEFDQYRDRRQQLLLQIHGQEHGLTAFIKEVGETGGTGMLPTTGILSPDLDEALDAASKS